MKYQPHLLLIGFNEHNFKQLQAQINSYALKLKITDQIADDNIDDVKAIIFDFDGQNLDENLSFCRNKLPPMIGLSKMPVKLDNIIVLKKPLSKGDLLSTLENIGILQKHEEQRPKEIRAVYSNPESKLHYPVKNCLQDYLLKAWKLHLKVKQPIELIFLNKPVLVIFDGKVSGSLTNEQLQQLCNLTIHEHSISTLLTNLPQGMKSVDASYFIAKIVLWSSRGRLPEGVNSTDIVELVESEQHPSLPKIEDAQIIKKLWSMEICSLQKTEHILGVTQSNLFSYFSVLYALDLVEIFSPNSPPTTKKKGKKQTSKLEWFGNKFFSKKKLIPNSL